MESRQLRNEFERKVKQSMTLREINSSNSQGLHRDY